MTARSQSLQDVGINLNRTVRFKPMHKPPDGCRVFQPFAQPMVTPSRDVMRRSNKPKTAVKVQHSRFGDLRRQLQSLHR